MVMTRGTSAQEKVIFIAKGFSAGHVCYSIGVTKRAVVVMLLMFVVCLVNVPLNKMKACTL
jgi:hypothetical protein